MGFNKTKALLINIICKQEIFHNNKSVKY